MSGHPQDYNNKQKSIDYSKPGGRSRRTSTTSRSESRYEPYSRRESTTNSGHRSGRQSTTGSRKPSLSEQYAQAPRNSEVIQNAHQELLENRKRLSVSTGLAVAEEPLEKIQSLGVEDLSIFADSRGFTDEKVDSVLANSTDPSRPSNSNPTAANRFPGRENFSTTVPNEGPLGEIVHEFRLKDDEVESIKGFDKEQLKLYRKGRLDEENSKGPAGRSESLDEFHLKGVHDVSLAGFDLI